MCFLEVRQGYSFNHLINLFMKNFSSILLIISILLLSLSAWSQELLDVKSMSRKQIKSLTYEQLIDISLEDLLYISEKFGISIDDLLEQSISVSSKTNLTSREAPGIISVLTAQEIENSGAEDLADLLRTIPGIYFGMDVDGVTGIFMRGNWGHEGKVLFLIDDMEFNENMYSVTQLINHIPASQINRVEVIRGPGSALYGGYAELGVIRVITHSGEELQRTELSGAVGSFGRGLNRTGFDFSTGQKVGNSSYSLMGSWSGIDRSGGSFTDFNGDTYNLEEGWSDSKNLFVNMKYAWKGLETNMIYDDYSVVPTGYETQNQNRFRNVFSQVKYAFQPSKTFKITPSVFFKSQTPYWFEDPSEEDYWFYKRTANQLTGAVDLIWSPSAKTQLLAGTGYRFDQAKISEDEQENVGETFYNGEFTINHQNLYMFAQGSYSGKLGNVFAGIRFENHSITGSNIAPRFGYTGVFGRFNIKYLYSHAFRSPSIENVNLNQDIDIEKTFVNEFLLGYRFTDHLYGSLNLFDIIIKNPIIYLYNYENDEEEYFNDTQTGTSGFETEFRFFYEKWSTNLSYSYYNSSFHNETDAYRVVLPTGEISYLMKGVPAHMVHMVSSVRVRKNIFINPSFSWYSAQYGFINSPDEQGKADPYLLADLSLQVRNVLVKNLDVSLSFRNILNSSYGYIQPVGISCDLESPMAGRPFEVALRLKYKFVK